MGPLAYVRGMASLGGKHWRLARSDFDVLRDRQINSLSLKRVAKLQTNVVGAAKLRITESPSGISRTWNVMQFEVHYPVVIAIVVFYGVSLVDLAPSRLIV